MLCGGVLLIDGSFSVAVLFVWLSTGVLNDKTFLIVFNIIQRTCLMFGYLTRRYVFCTDYYIIIDESENVNIIIIFHCVVSVCVLFFA